MLLRWKAGEYPALVRQLARWLLIATPVAPTIGSTPRSSSFLPLAGLAVGLLYHVWGKPLEGGNDLIIVPPARGSYPVSPGSSGGAAPSGP